MSHDWVGARDAIYGVGSFALPASKYTIEIEALDKGLIHSDRVSLSIKIPLPSRSHYAEVLALQLI